MNPPQTAADAADARPGYRAITLGPTKHDWAVVDEAGEIVYRGYAVYAARLACRLRDGACSPFAAQLL